MAREGRHTKTLCVDCLRTAPPYTDPGDGTCRICWRTKWSEATEAAYVEAHAGRSPGQLWANLFENYRSLVGRESFVHQITIGEALANITVDRLAKASRLTPDEPRFPMLLMAWTRMRAEWLELVQLHPDMRSVSRTQGLDPNVEVAIVPSDICDEN